MRGRPLVDNQTDATVLAFVIALLWAIHPLQTETVCYVTQRTELMVGLFYLATLYCSLHYWLAENAWSRATWLSLAVIACAAGMASKEVMVTAPVVVLLFAWTFLSHDLRRLTAKGWLLFVSLCFTWVLLAYLIADAPRSKSAGLGVGLSATTWWLTQAKVAVLYVKLAFWPWPLSIHYQMPYVRGVGDALPWLAVVAALIAGTLVALRRGWAVGFLGAWFFIILSPTSLVPIISEVAAERRMYLPLAAVVALVVVGGYRLAVMFSPRAETNQRTLPRSWAAGMVAVVAVLAVALGSVSYHRLAAYQTEVSIWQDALAKYPESEVAQLSLALALSRADRIDEAAEHFAAAIRLEPLNLYHRIRFAERSRKPASIPKPSSNCGKWCCVGRTWSKRNTNWGCCCRKPAKRRMRPSNSAWLRNSGPTIPAFAPIRRGFAGPRQTLRGHRRVSTGRASAARQCPDP